MLRDKIDAATSLGDRLYAGHACCCCTAMLHPNVHAERQRVKHFVQGLVAIPLAEILHKKTVKNTYQLDAAKHGQLQLEVRWMSILSGA